MKRISHHPLKQLNSDVTSPSVDVAADSTLHEREPVIEDVVYPELDVAAHVAIQSELCESLVTATPEFDHLAYVTSEKTDCTECMKKSKTISGYQHTTEVLVENLRISVANQNCYKDLADSRISVFERCTESDNTVRSFTGLDSKLLFTSLCTVLEA